MVLLQNPRVFTMLLLYKSGIFTMLLLYESGIVNKLPAGVSVYGPHEAGVLTSCFHQRWSKHLVKLVKTPGKVVSGQARVLCLVLLTAKDDKICTTLP